MGTQVSTALRGAVQQFVACPAHRRNVPVRTCAGCEHATAVVGCKHFGRAVPIEFCVRTCPLQRGARGMPDAATGVPSPLGVKLAPLAGPLESATCGAPWVLAEWGAPRSIFAGGATTPIEDPETNVVPACRFPRALSFGEADVVPPTRLEV